MPTIDEFSESDDEIGGFTFQSCVVATDAIANVANIVHNSGAVASTISKSLVKILTTHMYNCLLICFYKFTQYLDLVKFNYLLVYR